MNSFYNHSTYPGPNAPGSSAAMRAELELITAAFNKMPTLSGNGSKLLNVNAAGTAIEAGGAILSADFTTTGVADAVGRLTWNDTDGTLNLGMKGGNVVLQIGQEQLLRGYNNSGSAMTEMQVVYISGSSGQRPVISLARADAEPTSTKTIGVLTENIANNAEGFVNVNGLINNVDTSALTEGAVLWLSATVAGGLTTTKPTAPNHSVAIGYCVRSHATQGKIFVNVQNGYELDELHDVLISGLATNNMLRYDGTVWRNIAGPAGAVVGTTDTQTLTNKTISGGAVTGAAVTNLPTPSADADAATKAYVDSLAQGLDVKGSAKAATTANITLSGAQTIDGVSVIAGDRVLVKDQSTAAQNGLYVVAAGAWTRTTDMDAWAEFPGAFAFVEQGTVNDNSGWVCTVSAGGTLGVTAVTFEQFSGAGQITAGAGMTKTGNTLNVGTASASRIVVNTDDIDLATTGVSAGTYKSVTTDAYGRITGGTNPTTIAGFGITDAYTKTYIDTLYGSTASAAASAADALTYKTAAETAATTATTQAGIATTQASTATTQASTATTQAGIATSAANAAAASYDSFDDRYLGAKSTPPIVDNDGNPLLTGALYFDTTANEMRVYTGTTWKATGSAVNGTSSRAVYTATAGQTTFAITYDVGFVDVYLNGVKQQVAVDFVATSGTNIVLATGATAGDIVDIVAYGAFSVANTYTQAQTDTLLAAKQDTLVSGTSIKTVNGSSLLGSGNLAVGDVTTAGTQTLTNKTIDFASNTLTGVQPTLVSGTNIKTLNSTSLLGSGNIDITSVGSGGATATGSVTLTSASPAMQSITTTAYGQSVTLPDATTLTKGVPVFGIFSVGPYPLLIKDSAGTLLGFANPQSSVICSLANNSTASGDWDLLGHSLYGIDASSPITFASNTANFGYMRAVALDANRTMLILSGTASMHAIVYDQSTLTFGSPVLVRTANIADRFAAMLQTTNAVLVVSGDNGTAIEAVVLTVSSTTITVNTAATATASDSLFSFGDYPEIVQVGSTYIFAYATASTGSIRAMTVSGTTVSVGSQVNALGTGTTPVVFADSSTVALVFSQAASSTIYAHPYTVSGTSLTAGASTSLACDLNGFRVRQVGARYAIIYFNSAGSLFRGSIVSVSGTTATASTATLYSVSSSIAMGSTYCQVFGSQVLVGFIDNAGVRFGVNVLTDNSGTAVAGTAISRAVSYASLSYFGATASEMRFMYYRTNTTAAPVAVSVGISGNNPVINSSDIGSITAGSVQLPDVVQSYKWEFFNSTFANSSLAVGAIANSATVAFAFTGKALFTLPALSLFSPKARLSATEAWTSAALEQGSGASSFVNLSLYRVRMAA